MKIYLDNNLGVSNVEQEELTQDTIGYNILKIYIPNAVLTPYDTFTCYYGALLQNGRKVGWFAMEARTSTDADYQANYTLYKATLEQCVVSVEGKVYIGCQVLLGNSGNATLIKKNTAVVQFNVRKSVAINNDILVLDTDQTTTDVLESYKNLLENALTTYATKATTYTKTEVNGALALKADKSDTYTKTEVNSALALKADRDDTDSRFLLIESAIDDLTSVQNVVEVVPTYSALQSYDTTKLDANDKVQVIADESHDGASTIYNWSGSAWVYVGAYGTNSYTIQESDNKFALKSTAVTHDGNQLKDNNGNDIYPNLEDDSIENFKLKQRYSSYINTSNPISNYTGSATTAVFYFKKHIYQPTYIISIKVQLNTSGTVNIAIVDASTNSVKEIITYTSDTIGTIEIPINKLYPYSFYIGTNGAMGYEWASVEFSQFLVRNVFLNATLTFNWTTSGAVKLAFEVVENSVLYNAIMGLYNSSNIKTSQFDDNKNILGYADVSLYPSNTINDYVWGNNNLYNSGYVKNVLVKVNQIEDIKIWFVDSDGNLLKLFEYTPTSTGFVSISINEYIYKDFYILIKGGIAYTGNPTSIGIPNDIATGIYFYTANPSNVGLAGEVISITWDTSAHYTIAIQVEYYSLQYKINELLNFNCNNAIRTNKTNLSNNKMFVIGDSITAGHPYENVIGIHWWEQVSKQLGYDVTRGARSGAGFIYKSGGENAITLSANVDFAKYNVIVYAFGTNDYGNETPIGAIDDMYPTNETLYGAMNYLVNQILAANPKAQLIFSLPINRRQIHGSIVGSRDTKWCYGYENNINQTLLDYCDAIINICNKYSLAYIDNRTGAFNVYALQYLLVDNLHPTKYGYKILGQQMASKIGAIVQPFIEE